MSKVATFEFVPGAMREVLQTGGQAVKAAQGQVMNSLGDRTPSGGRNVGPWATPMERTRRGRPRAAVVAELGPWTTPDDMIRALGSIRL